MAGSWRIDLEFTHLIYWYSYFIFSLSILDTYYEGIIMKKQLLNELIPYILLFILK